MSNILALDNNLFAVIYSLPHPFLLILIMEFFSVIGYFGLVWIVLGIYCKKLKPVLFALILVFLIVEFLLKLTIARARPYPSMFDQFLPWESFSFPSGHAAAAFASLYILTKFKILNQKFQINSKSKILKNKNTFTIWTIAILVSFSRVYLGRHYALDVIAGGIIGWMIGYLVNFYFSKFDA